MFPSRITPRRSLTTALAGVGAAAALAVVLGVGSTASTAALTDSTIAPTQSASHQPSTTAVASPSHRAATTSAAAPKTRPAAPSPIAPRTHPVAPADVPGPSTLAANNNRAPANPPAPVTPKPAASTHVNPPPVKAAPPKALAPAPAPQSGAAWIAQGVLAMLNGERRAHGLPALQMNSMLISSAHAHNLVMAQFNEMSHQLPGELFFADRILRAGYNYLYAGENIGWNSQMTQAGADALETLMYNEVAPNDDHRKNILSVNYTQIGIDIYLDAAHGKLWLTEDFGKPQ